MDVSEVPDALVDSRGKARFGVYQGVCKNVNLDEAELTWAGVRLPRALVRFRLKEWQHFALILPDLFCGLAVVDAKFLATSWCHVVDRLSGHHFEHGRQGLLAERKVARELWDDNTVFRARGGGGAGGGRGGGDARGYRIEVHNHLARGEHRLFVDIAASRGKPAVRAELTCVHDLEEIRPLVVMLPVGPNRAMYSHKVALPLKGTVEVGGERSVAVQESSFAIVDVHKAHYPHHTWWKWATFAGRGPSGRLVALNLTRNVNSRDDVHNENALWVDGRIERLGPALFDFDPKRVLDPWRIRTADGRVDLTFRPQGERAERVHAGLIKSAFHQPYGTFEGTVRFGDETVDIDSMFGVCEDHDALW